MGRVLKKQQEKAKAEKAESCNGSFVKEGYYRKWRKATVT